MMTPRCAATNPSPWWNGRSAASKPSTCRSARCITGWQIGCAHVFLCMLAYYLEWHMRQRLALMLFDDTDKEAAEALRKSVVAQAQRSPAAVKKQTTGLTEDGLPVHSFRSLLADLATLARNTIITAITPNYPLAVLTRPTSVQQTSNVPSSVASDRQIVLTIQPVAQLQLRRSSG